MVYAADLLFFMQYYIQLTTTADSAQQEILIALLSENGFEGFEENENELRAFIAEKDFHEGEIQKIFTSLSLSYEKKIIQQMNWNEEWEKNFDPIIVDDFCGIRAAFHHPIKNVAHEIIITPKMSFGTGHHATTFLMIEAMRDIDFTHKTVLDFGTGTGILAILSEKLGAGKIYAIDNDEWSIINAQENIIANDSKNIIVEQADRINFSNTRFDIILANVNRNVILDQLPFIRQQLKPQSVVLLSGLLNEDFDEVEKQARNNNLSILSKSLKNNWICLRFSKE